MQIKFLRLSLAALACFCFINWGCTKIDTTELGADLIPAVDNVHTFADTLEINGSREPNIDSNRLASSENHVLGSINNDPVFGKTKADLFLELKPGFFPYYFGNANDTINPIHGTQFDSVILCLSYKGYYGDTTLPQKLSVYALDQNTSNFKDSVYRLDFQPNQPYTNLIGQAVIDPLAVKKQVFINGGQDSVTNQVRIKLDNSFLNVIKSFDSSATSLNNAFHSDSVFKEIFKGFAVVSDNGSSSNGLFYISLTDALTRLEIHYTKRNAGVIDTSYSTWNFSTGTSALVSRSAQANYLKRDTAGSEFAVSPQADALYIQSAPGSAVNLSIPELTNYPNRIIHRAEVFIEQVPGDPMLDKVLTPPAYLYLDLIDDTANPRKYKPVYFDLSPNTFYLPDVAVSGSFFPSGGIDHNYFGGFLRSVTDSRGTRSYYSFNLTRYVQNMITQGGINYKMRVYAPYNLSYYGFILTYSNNLAFGRVKIGNGNNPNYRMRMRIVYSNL